MNKELIKSIIKYKLNLADKVIKHLPANISDEVEGLREIIIECINEDFKEREKSNKVKKPEINNVTIE